WFEVAVEIVGVSLRLGVQVDVFLGFLGAAVTTLDTSDLVGGGSDFDHFVDDVLNELSHVSVVEFVTVIKVTAGTVDGGLDGAACVEGGVCYVEQFGVQDVAGYVVIELFGGVLEPL